VLEEASRYSKFGTGGNVGDLAARGAKIIGLNMTWNGTSGTGSSVSGAAVI
jgi:hypothetical protein